MPYEILSLYTQLHSKSICSMYDISNRTTTSLDAWLTNQTSDKKYITILLFFLLFEKTALRSRKASHFCFCEARNVGGKKNTYGMISTKGKIPEWSLSIELPLPPIAGALTRATSSKRSAFAYRKCLRIAVAPIASIVRDWLVTKDVCESSRSTTFILFPPPVIADSAIIE